MKKVVSFVLALTLCLCLAACGGEQKDASALYKSAITKMDKDSMAAKMAVNMTVKAGTASTDVNMEMDFATKGTGDAATMAMKMKAGAQGMTIDMGVYLTDGYYYMDVLGIKMKQSVKEANATTTGQLNNLAESLLFGEDAITIEKSEKKDGNTVISFTVSAEKLSELVELLGGQTMQGMSNVTIESVAGTVTIDSNEKLVAETMDLTYSAEVNGEKAQASMTLTLSDIQFGDSVKVELPDDLSEYAESGASGLNL